MTLEKKKKSTECKEEKQIQAAYLKVLRKSILEDSISGEGKEKNIYIRGMFK